MNDCRARLLIVTTLLTVLLGMVCTTSISQTWQDHTDAGELAFAYGDLERAEGRFRSALELAGTLPAGDRRLEASLENLARLLEHQHRLDEAQPLYELLLAAQEARAGSDSPALLDTLRAAGRVALRAGDVPAGEAHLRRYVQLAEQQHPQDSDQESLRAVLSTLSRTCVLQERPTEALQLQQRAVALLQGSALTPTEQAAEIETLAQLELLHGTAEHAEQLLLDAIALRAEDGEEGEAAGSTATVMAAAATTAFGAGELAVAGRLAERALAAAGTPAEQLAAQSVLADISWLAARRGNTQLAELLLVAADSEELRQAEHRLTALLELQRQLLGTTDPAVTETSGRLVQVRVLRGNAAAAAELQRQVVERHRAGAAPALAAALDDLVVLLIAAGEQEQAVEVNSELVEQLELQHGAADLQLLPALERQLELLTQLKRKKAARPIKKQVKKLRKQARR